MQKYVGNLTAWTQNRNFCSFWNNSMVSKCFTSPNKIKEIAAEPKSHMRKQFNNFSHLCDMPLLACGPQNKPIFY